ncbi:hypothetical protein NLJ89_g3842 [Agrocybe chaxingu]|uniref:AAA+ ATPase domain-containing protein n=1 Tax=Agrocybe chaxingu TaxID=84603 RepID=A0A9W8MYB8_9AGAR|nr:hypothetical protein NLJ89_g3842 [Agrocybe chaxingu]
MALPDPSWRVKIVHAPGVVSHKPASGSITEAGPSTPHVPPRVVIDSPKSIRSPPRSPRTTSLLLALRDAIGDLDEEEDGEERPDLQDSAISSRSPPNPWSESLPTLVNSEGFGQYSQAEDDSFEEEAVYPDEEYDANWTAISDYDDEHDDVHTQHQEALDQVNTLLRSEQQPPEEGEPTPISTLPMNEEPEDSIENSRQNRESIASIATSASGLLSPIELSTLNLGPLDLGSRSTRESSFDSGYAEHWKPPAPMPSSPPRSPSINSTFELLSSPFGAHSHRILSPRLGVFMPRQHVSPTRTISPAIQEGAEPQDLGLDSPQEYHAAHDNTREPHPAPIDDVGSKQGGALEEQRPKEVADESAQSDVSSSDEEDWFEHQSFGHTSIWNGENPTAVFVGMSQVAPAESSDVLLDSPNSTLPLLDEVNAAISRLSSSPVHFLTSNEPQFSNDEPVADSSTVAGDTTAGSTETESEGFSLSDFPPVPTTHHTPPVSPDPEDTAFLAYLRSPEAVVGPENDTLNSLYDIYSGIASPADIIADSMRNAHLSPPPAEPTPLSNTSTPASSLRERVFTPPPPARKRSGTITADPPTSLPSPITSLDSMSMGRASPFSQADFKSSPDGSASHSAPAQEVEVSRKIPFGFRNSISLGRTNRSSIMTSRNGARSIPPSPLENEIPTTDMTVSEPGPLSTSPAPASESAPAPKGLKPLRLSAFFHADSNSRSTPHSRMSTTSVNSFCQSALIYALFSHTLASSYFFINFGHSLSPFALFTYIPFKSHLLRWTTHGAVDVMAELDELLSPIKSPVSQVPYTAPVSRALSPLHHHAIATPRPTLMFAIASDNVEQVREVLESGDAGPNEAVGPLSALEFTLTNDKLSNKLEIVKTLLAYGADPTVATNKKVPAPSGQIESEEDGFSQEEPPVPPTRSLMDEMDPATRYYVERADAVHTRRTSALIHRSFFRPLTRVRYELVGQDRALEQLFRVLSMHSRQLALAPMVVMLCGPSGHGKSLLARKFGSLLDVPTHTVNMTTLKSTHDLWQSYSMSPYEVTPTTCTLAEFLINNEGKRCVVVLDEIEKTVDQKALFSLLMPWELGRCAFEASSRHIDVRNVIWLGTSNIGHDLVFEHRESRKNPEDLMSREEYVELMALLRPRVSEKLGASVMSRITTVLPFVPFTLEEKRAICSEALCTLGGDAARTLSSSIVDTVINAALADYCAVEGASQSDSISPLSYPIIKGSEVVFVSQGFKGISRKVIRLPLPVVSVSSSPSSLTVFLPLVFVDAFQAHFRDLQDRGVSIPFINRMIDQRTTLHRMVRVKQARAPAPTPLTLDFRTVTAMQIQTETIVLQPSSASARADASFMIPKTTLVLAIVIACLSLALILLIVIVLYRRHHQRKNKQTTPSRSNAFDSDSFVEKRRSLDKERFGSDQTPSLQSPNTPSTASSRTPIVGWQTPNSAVPLRVTNDEGSESEYEEDRDPSRRYTADTIEGAYSSQPIRLTEFAAKEKAKRKENEKASASGSVAQPSVAGLKLKTNFKSKSRPSWLKPVKTTGQNLTQRTEDTGRSPPPAYAAAAATSQGYQSPHLVPIPPLLPLQKSRHNMEMPPPTPPASRKSHASIGPTPYGH